MEFIIPYPTILVISKKVSFSSKTIEFLLDVKVACKDFTALFSKDLPVRIPICL